jgi:uncharacterized membrane protein YraQ (UPF0718 family)
MSWWFAFSWQNFWFSFLALVFEGVPFILLGSLISGVIGSFVPAHIITGLLPKSRFPALLVSGLLGLIFPVCDCGIVPIVRRILKKGVPLSCGITYMLASPIVNPLVISSTIIAFQGQAPLLNAGLRIGFGYFIAVMIGLIVGSLQSESILRKGLITTGGPSRTGIRIAPLHDHGSEQMEVGFVRKVSAGVRIAPLHDHGSEQMEVGFVRKVSAGVGMAPLHDHGSEQMEVGFVRKVSAGVRMATDDFLRTCLYFMVGAAIAATFNTAVNQRVILPLASDSVLSIISMMTLSGILTLCSTSDAFIAATFVTFPSAARMAFMIFGPMFDLKLIFLYSSLFKKRFVIALGVALFLFVGLICSILISEIYAIQDL